MEIDNSLYLFGSHARGDNSINSDIDYILIAEEINPDPIVYQKYINNLNVDVSYYQFSKIKEYFEQGHLFAWHLFLESKHLAGGDVLKSLGRPKDYLKVKEDVEELLKILDSIKIVIESNLYTSSLIYEAGLLYVVLRNIGHSISWHEHSQPCFHRFVPYTFKENGPILYSDYKILLNARGATTRGNSCSEIKKDWFKKILSESENWIYSKIKDYI